MAYGPLRFFYNNFLTSADMITPSTWEDGTLSGTRKTGSGVSTITVTGPFQAAKDLSFTLEIDSITGGTEIGEATFKWRNSDTAVGSWEEIGVLTRTTPAYALSADGLDSNLTVAHTGGVGNDFALGDSWHWVCKATYGPQRVLDRNRMTAWRNDTTTGNLVCDIGSAQTPTVIAIHDHNFTSGATVTIEGNAADSWGSPSYTYTWSAITDPLYYYIPTTQTYRYWRIVVSDVANPDGYLEAANLFLGTYLQLSALNGEWGSAKTQGYVLQSNRSQSNVFRRYAYADQQILTINFGKTLSPTDVDSLVSMQAALIDSSTKRVLPCWVHGFSDEADTLRLMDWADIDTFNYTFFRYLLNSGATLDLPEVVKI